MSETEADTVNLTREQIKFLEECNEEFVNRFSEEDEEYKKAYKNGIPAPPIVCPWYGRPRLTAKRSGQRNYQGRYDRDRYDSWDRNTSKYRDSRQHRDNYNRYAPY